MEINYQVKSTYMELK